MSEYMTRDEVALMLSDLADEVARAAKYHRVAVQYSQASDTDRMAVVVIDGAVEKIRARIR